MRVVVFLGTCSPPPPRIPPLSPLLIALCPFSSSAATSVACVCAFDVYVCVFVGSRSLLLLAIFCFSGDLVPLFRRWFLATLHLPPPPLPHTTEHKGKWRKQNLKTTISALARHTRRCVVLVLSVRVPCRVFLLFWSSNEKITLWLCGWGKARNLLKLYKK